MSAPAIEGHVVTQLRTQLSLRDWAADALPELRARLVRERADLAIERSSLPRQIATAEAEVEQLAKSLDSLTGPARRAIEERLEEAGRRLTDLGTRMTLVERRQDALEDAGVEAEWIAESLRDFDPLWEALTPVNRGRLLKAVIDCVTVNRAGGTVRIQLADLSTSLPGACS